MIQLIRRWKCEYRKIITRTFSVAAVVEIEGEKETHVGKRTAFLKLYDRRCRTQNRVKPWSHVMEDEYFEAVRGGSVFDVIEDLCAETDDAASQEVGSDGEIASSI